MKQLTMLFFLVLSYAFFSVELKAQNDGEVIIYSGAEYKDAGQVLTLDGKDKKEYPRLSTDFSSKNWNDNISSIKVGKGVRVRAYTGMAFKDSAFDLFPGSYPTLCDPFKDAISSIELIKIDKDEPVVTVWMDKDQSTDAYRQYIGFGKTTEEGISKWNQNLSTGDASQIDYMGLMCANDAQHIDIPDGLAVTICDETFLDGDCHTFIGPTYVTLASYDLEEDVSSISIKRIGYDVYKIEIIEEDIIDKPEEKDLEVGAGSTSVNHTSVSQDTELEIASQWSKSTEWVWSSSTSIGRTMGVEVSIIPLIETVSGETKIEETVTVGKNTTTSKQETRTLKQKVNVPPGKIITATAYMKPVKIVQKLKIYMKPTDGINAKEKVEIATRTIETAYKAYFEFNEIGNQGSQDKPVGGSPNKPSTSTPSTSTPTENTAWAKKPGKAKSIRAGGNGKIFIVGVDNILYQWNYTNETWVTTGKRDVQDYAIATDNSIWTIEENGDIYRFGGSSGSEEKIIFEGLVQSFPVGGNKILGCFGKKDNVDNVFALQKNEQGKVTKIQMIQFNGSETIALKVPELGDNTYIMVKDDKKVYFADAGNGGVPDEAKFKIGKPFVTEGSHADRYHSFESVKYPNHFLRHAGWVLQVSTPDGGVFQLDASWLVK